jgi:multidrug efflux pump subunit AcrA (membrane-fusion protein)
VLAVSAAKAAEAAAEADVALAQARLNRANSLKPKNYVSVDEAAQVAAALKSAEAQRALRRAERGQAELRLTRTTLRAPFDAIVLKRDAQVGMLANVGTPLITLIDRGGVEIAATVEANQVLSLRQAPEVQFRANGEPVPVLIKRISAALDRGTRTAEARLQFAGFAAPIGSEGRIEWRDAEALLPAEYLTRRDGALGVFWFDGKVARFEPLPAAQEGRPTAVSLPPTAAIIVRGRQGLRDGQAVSIAR